MICCFWMVCGKYSRACSYSPAGYHIGGESFRHSIVQRKGVGAWRTTLHILSNKPLPFFISVFCCWSLSAFVIMLATWMKKSDFSSLYFKFILLYLKLSGNIQLLKTESYCFLSRYFLCVIFIAPDKLKGSSEGFKYWL